MSDWLTGSHDDDVCSLMNSHWQLFIAGAASYGQLAIVRGEESVSAGRI